MAIEIKSPMVWDSEHKDNRFTIFLAGSIDQGAAFDWQKYLIDALKDYNVILFNPRRDKWDSTWKQTVDNENFVEQVKWEQYYLTLADYRIFVMLDGSMSPITLLELGQFIKKPGVIFCGKDFYRRGNIEITAKLNNMKVIDTLDQLIIHLKSIIPSVKITDYEDWFRYKAAHD
jgi:hypothetical protein